MGTLRGIIEHVINLHKTSLCSPKISLKFERNKRVQHTQLEHPPPLLQDGRHWPIADVLLGDLLLPLLLHFVVILKVIFAR